MVSMLIKVNRAMVVPLVDQVRDQIVAAITTGDFAPGERLPPIRQLAEFLDINRNTVAQAYRMLEHDGWVTTRAGGGTTVSETVATEVKRTTVLRKLVRDSLAEATSTGFTAQEFAELACYEAAAMSETPRPFVARILVIDEYPGELASIKAAAGDALPDCVLSDVLLDDLAALDADARRERVAECDFALVPFYCLERAAELLDGSEVPVLAAGLGPSLGVLDTIRKAVADAERVALVCTGAAGPAHMERTLRSAGVTLPSTVHCAADGDDLRTALSGCDVVIASEGSADAVADAVPDANVVHYSAMLKESSLRTIRSYLCRAGTAELR